MNTNENIEVPTFEALIAAAMKALYQICQNNDEPESLELLPRILMAIIEHPDSKNHELLTHVCGQLYGDSVDLFSNHWEMPKEFH